MKAESESGKLRRFVHFGWEIWKIIKLLNKSSFLHRLRVNSGNPIHWHPCILCAVAQDVRRVNAFGNRSTQAATQAIYSGNYRGSYPLDSIQAAIQWVTQEATQATNQAANSDRCDRFPKRASELGKSACGLRSVACPVRHCVCVCGSQELILRSGDTENSAICRTFQPMQCSRASGLPAWCRAIHWEAFSALKPSTAFKPSNSFKQLNISNTATAMIISRVARLEQFSLVFDFAPVQKDN